MSPVTRVNVDRMTVKEFLDHQEKRQKANARARERERAEVKRELTALAEKRGFTLREFLDDDGKRKLDGRINDKVVAPKFANPDDPSQT